jgi:response regulator NasT
MVAMPTEQFTPTHKRSVLLVDNCKSRESEQCSVLKKTLLDLHYEVTDFIDDPLMLSVQCLQHLPDILIINTTTPSPHLISQLSSINQHNPLPVLLFTQHETPSLIKSSIKAGVSALIINNTQPNRLKSIIDVAFERFEQQQGLVKELQQTKNQLADRKIVERAKGYIMEQKDISEQAAFTLLRNMAMNNGQTIVQVSNNIISVFATH